MKTCAILVAVVLAGFPVVLALSWVFDVTRSGLKRTGPEGSEVPATAPTPSFAVVGFVVVCAVGLGWGGWYAVRSGDATVVAATGAPVLCSRCAENAAGESGNGSAHHDLQVGGKGLYQRSQQLSGPGFHTVYLAAFHQQL